jgi:hypothetical protein
MSYSVSRTLLGDLSKQAHSEKRVGQYYRYKKLYDGLAVRRNTSQTLQYKFIAFNYAPLICDVAADFLAANGLTLSVPEDDVATELLKQAWRISGGNAEFYDNAANMVVKGDACLGLTYDPLFDQHSFTYFDPCYCFPVFDGHDNDNMVALVKEYKLEGGKVYREEWANGEVRRFLDGVETTERDDDGQNLETYDEALFSGVPFVWVRNKGAKGEVYGTSELKDVDDMVLQYDHLKRKRGRQVDYHMMPNLKGKGMTKSQLGIEKGERTVFFVPKDGDLEFIEWKGDQPDVNAHIDSVRRDIAAISQTPMILLGDVGQNITDITGIALKVMYAPLISKTKRKQTEWERAFKRMLGYVLTAEGYTDVDTDDIKADWQTTVPVNEREEWEVALLQTEAGVSKRQVLKERGYTDEEIDRMESEKGQEDQALGQAAMRMFNRGQGTQGQPYDQGQQATQGN